MWRIGKRRFGKNWARRMKLFKVDLDGNGVRSENMGVGKREKMEKNGGKIYEVGELRDIW